MPTPVDPKNAFFLGLSVNRWILIIGISTAVVAFITALLQRNRIQPKISIWFSRISGRNGLFFTTLSALALLWVTVWLPPDRWPSLAEEIVRFKPFLIFAELVTLEILIYFQWSRIKEKAAEIYFRIKIKRKFGVFVSFITIVILFVVLRIVTENFEGRMGFTSPGSFLSPLQILFVLLIFIALFQLENRREKKEKQNRLWDFAIFLVIWLGVFLLWTYTPFTCVDDRTAAFAPNFICYPQVDDSVYSIGSHYIGLGRGIFNHWFTDKPFYLLFLAVGQWIFGNNIDQYLIFQTAVIALIPAILFLFVKRLLNYSAGLSIAILTAPDRRKWDYLVFGCGRRKYQYRKYGVINRTVAHPFDDLPVQVF